MPPRKQPPPDTRPPLGISYLRFSTTEQGKGDSRRRQTKDSAAWCERNKIALPADQLIAHIDRNENIAQYWLPEAVVEQGSVVGLFDSELDSIRQKHSRLYNVARHRWTKWRRRTFRRYWVRAFHALRGGAQDSG